MSQSTLSGAWRRGLAEGATGDVMATLGAAADGRPGGAPTVPEPDGELQLRIRRRSTFTHPAGEP